jgi:hypothetical protein
MMLGPIWSYMVATKGLEPKPAEALFLFLVAAPITDHLPVFTGSPKTERLPCGSLSEIRSGLLIRLQQQHSSVSDNGALTNVAVKLVSTGPLAKAGHRSNWAKIEIGAGECEVPSLFASDARGGLQRFVGDFVYQDFIFRPVDSDRGGVAHRYPPRCPARPRLMKGMGMNPSVT